MYIHMGKRHTFISVHLLKLIDVPDCKGSLVSLVAIIVSTFTLLACIVPFTTSEIIILQ